MTLAGFGPAVITAIGLLLALAGTLAPTEEGAASGSLATRLIVPLPDWLVMATVAALAAASLILLAIIVPQPRPRRKKGEKPYELYHEPRKAPPTVVVLLILLALTPPGILAASILWLDRHEVSLHGGTAGAEKAIPPASPSPTAQSHPSDLPPRSASRVTADLLGALALLAGFGSLGVMLWLRFGDRLWRPPLDGERSWGHLAAAIEESLEDLQLERDARAAIVKCYGRFEHFLAAAEYPRAPWETPVEFMRGALRKLPLPSAAVASLTGLFEIARFSQHAVGASEREDAWRSLLEIREALNHSKEEPDAAPA